MAKIAVVGMGQGGMVSAIKLASLGHEIDIYERSEKGSVSYDWTDDIRSDIFKICDLPMPSEDVYVQKPKWLFVAPNEKDSLPFPPLPPMEEISVYRRKLSAYFAELAESANCKIHYATKVDNLVVKDERVVGIVVDGGALFYDLVIDASGMRSALRADVPAKFGIQKQPKEDGVMYGYRAFFKKTEGAKTVEDGLDSTVVLKHLGSTGISWCNLLEDGKVDVLIGRVGSISDEEINLALADLKKFNAILSDEMISEHRAQICLRASISGAVADGYVAIGDSAFMTMPLLGSGIEASMKAGKMFADFVKDNGVTDFSAHNTWGFFAKYMRELGSDFALIDALKRYLLTLDPKRIDWLFGSGVVSKDDLAMISTDTSGKVKVRAKTVFMILAHPIFLFKTLKHLLKGLKASKCAKKIPAGYDGKRIAKWRRKYDKLINA